MIETLVQLKKAVEFALSRGDVALVPDLARGRVCATPLQCIVPRFLEVRQF